MRPPVHRQRVRQTVRRADESGTRNGTPELSSCPSLTLRLPYSFAAASSFVPRRPSSSDDTYRIAPSPPALDTEPGMRTALAEERWLCTNSPTWDAHFQTLSSSTLLARAALHLVEHLRTRSHLSEGSIVRSWRVISGPRSKVRARSPRENVKGVIRRFNIFLIHEFIYRSIIIFITIVFVFYTHFYTY